MREDQLVLGGQRVEFILRRAEFASGDVGDFPRDGCIEALGRVESRADRRAAECQLAQWVHRQQQHLPVLFQAASPAGNFLREFDRRRVLQMCSAGFDNALVFRLKPAKRRGQLVNRRQHLLFDRFHRRNVHRGRECVVRRLGHVDIVIRMQQLFARDFIAAVGNDLVGIHV